MNKETSLLNDFQKIRTTIPDSLATTRDDFFLLPAAEQKPHLIHKLRRIVTEMKYAEKNSFKFCSLTLREKEIIKLIVSGFNNPQISGKLFISRRTVEQHRKNINRKLETNLLPEICVFAYAFDLV